MTRGSGRFNGRAATLAAAEAKMAAPGPSWCGRCIKHANRQEHSEPPGKNRAVFSKNARHRQVISDLAGGLRRPNPATTGFMRNPGRKASPRARRGGREKLAASAALRSSFCVRLFWGISLLMQKSAQPSRAFRAFPPEFGNFFQVRHSSPTPLAGELPPKWQGTGLGDRRRARG